MVVWFEHPFIHFDCVCVYLLRGDCMLLCGNTFSDTIHRKKCRLIYEKCCLIHLEGLRFVRIRPFFVEWNTVNLYCLLVSCSSIHRLNCTSWFTFFVGYLYAIIRLCVCPVMRCCTRVPHLIYSSSNTRLCFNLLPAVEIYATFEMEIWFFGRNFRHSLSPLLLLSMHWMFWSTHWNCCTFCIGHVFVCLLPLVIFSII